MDNPTETPFPAKPGRRRRFWIVCIAALIFLSLFWAAVMVAYVDELLGRCVTDPTWSLWVLVPATLPWLSGLLWLRRTPETATRMPSYLVANFVICFILFVVSAIGVEGIIPSSQAYKEEWVVRNLRIIITAEATYASTYNTGYSASLAALGPAPGNTPASASAAGLVDEWMASGKVGFGYDLYSYTPGSPDADGRIRIYSLSTRTSVCKGARNFFTDQSGVIRATTENRPATPNDPAIHQ